MNILLLTVSLSFGKKKIKKKLLIIFRKRFFNSVLIIDFAD